MVNSFDMQKEESRYWVWIILAGTLSLLIHIGILWGVQWDRITKVQLIKNGGEKGGISEIEVEMENPGEENSFTKELSPTEQTVKQFLDVEPPALSEEELIPSLDQELKNWEMPSADQKVENNSIAHQVVTKVATPPKLLSAPMAPIEKIPQPVQKKIRSYTPPQFISNSPNPGANEGGISARPDYRKNPKPIYPSAARRAGVEGTVIFSVLVDEKGNPLEYSISISSGSKILDRSASKAIKQWKFHPKMKNGLAVKSWAKIPISFQLQ